MNIGRRAILLLGDRSSLVDLNAGPFKPRVVAVHDDGPPLSEPNEVAAWLREHVARGTEVDIVYQQHILSVETFPALDPHELPGALAVRLKRDMLVAPESLVSHTVPLSLVTHAQAVYAGVMSATHLTVMRMIGAARLEVGRVAFIGQLGMAALKHEAPGGGWTVLSDSALGHQLLLAVGADGQAFTANYPAETDLRHGGLDIVKLHLPKLVNRTPVALGHAYEKAPLAGARLTAPMTWIVPALLRDVAWRVPSTVDVTYPNYFGNVTWGFMFTMFAMFLYVGYQVVDLRDRESTAPEVQRVTDQVTQAASERQALEAKLGALDQLERNTQFLQGELYSTDAWFHLVSELRDRVSPGLLFDSVSDMNDYIVLAGSTQNIQEIVRLYKALVSRMADDNLVKLFTIDRDKGGKSTYRLQIKRSTFMPPAGKV